MYALDFLSESPTIFIFNKETNKTNFGGVLFLQYIIVMILISLVYILDYAINKKFTYESFLFLNQTDDKIEQEKKEQDEKINPYLYFKISFNNSNYGIWNRSSESPIENSYTDYYGNTAYYFKEQASIIDITIFYICGDDENCTSLKDIKEKNYCNITMEYPEYPIIHSEDPPVKEYPMTFYKSLKKLYKLDFEVWNYDWEIIRYNDQKSLFDTLTNKKTDYIFGHIKNIDYNRTFYDIGDEFYYHDRFESEELGYIFPLYRIKFSIDFDNYLYYNRKKISFLDILANIGALFSTIKFVFSFVFSFYAQNFNNYKIIGNILNPPKEQSKKRELSSDFKTSSPKDIDDNTQIDDIPLIDKEVSENQLITKVSDINKDINKNDINIESSSFVLDKMHFYDYFYNNIYLQCCKKRRNQEILKITNEIMHKYLSIDSLLLNQIKLEHLFKDYNWNNPALNNILNNKLIIKLKNT